MKKLIFSLILSFLIFLPFSYGQMVDNAVSLGIDTTFGSGAFGGSISFVDFNQDGWDDLTFSTELGDSILFYVNNQGSGFTRIPSLVNNTALSKQVIWADTDNDGDLDLFVCTSDGQNNFYQNNGNLELADSTYTCGILIQNDVSYGANFGDYDHDGDLDLFVSNRQPSTYGNTFYRNDGNNKFVDISASVGINLNYEADFCSAFLDYDNDLDLDLYTIVDKYPANNKLFRNEGTGIFTDVSVASGAGIYIDAMNAGVGDFNGDGYLDIYITNTWAGSALLKNNGDGTFSDIAVSAGVDIAGGIHWGASWLDVDNDKDLDLYVCSFHNNPSWNNRLFENHGNSTFSELVTGGLPGDTLTSFSCATGDYNQDGLVDIVVSNNYEYKIQLWENELMNTNNFARIKLQGVSSNMDGIGSWIEIYTEGQKQVRFTHTAISYLAQNSLTQHFGIGNYPYIDSLIIRWPSGTVDSYYCLDANTTFKATEGTSLINLKDLGTTNIWLGGSGSITDNAKWSLGHSPLSGETVILRSPDNSAITITNPLASTMNPQYIQVEEDVTFINNGTVNMASNGGNGLRVFTDAFATNTGTLNITDVCDHAIEVSGTFTNQGTISVSGQLGKDAIKVNSGGLLDSKSGTMVTLNPD